MSGALEDNWRSFHIFYHADRNLLLRCLVRPVVTALFTEGVIGSFFFLRFPLGGPHVRLRLRVWPGKEEEVDQVLAAAAADFFARWPSRESLSQEAVREGNRSILAGDPHEDDDSVYPDNTLLRFPCRFEDRRYGGPEMLGSSIDFFTISSVQALRFLDDHWDEPDARQLSAAFRLLVRYAWGLAGNIDDLLALLEYPMPAWRNVMMVFSEYGDQVYEKNTEMFIQLLHRELVTSVPGEGVEAARRLAWEIRGADLGTRRRIATSQMHMTANRLGLKNRDEVYLSRLMWRAGRDLLGMDPALAGILGETLERRAEEPPTGSLSDFLRRALEDLAAAPRSARI